MEKNINKMIAPLLGMMMKYLSTSALAISLIITPGNPANSLETKLQIGDPMPPTIGTVVNTKQWRQSIHYQGIFQGRVIDGLIRIGPERLYDSNGNGKPDYSASFVECDGKEHKFAHYDAILGVVYISADFSGKITDIIGGDSSSPGKDAPPCQS